MIWIGPPTPAPNLPAMISIATRGLALGGRMPGPDDPIRRPRTGAASVPTMSSEIPRNPRTPHDDHRPPCHTAPSADFFRLIAHLLTRFRAWPRIAGSNVSAAAPANATAIIAAKPIDLKAATLTSCVPARATTTVIAETNTALPEEAMASPIDCETARSARSCSRNRVRMNNE